MGILVLVVFFTGVTLAFAWLGVGPTFRTLSTASGPRAPPVTRLTAYPAAITTASATAAARATRRGLRARGQTGLPELPGYTESPLIPEAVAE